MLKFIKFFSLSFVLLFLITKKALSLPETWCVTKDKNSIMTFSQSRAPVPPLKPKSFNKCPGEYLIEVKINEVKKYYSTKNGQKNYAKLLSLGMGQ